jgi:hypothetical protein
LSHLEQQAQLLRKAKQKKEANALRKEAERIRAIAGPVAYRMSIDIRALQRQR